MDPLPTKLKPRVAPTPDLTAVQPAPPPQQKTIKPAAAKLEVPLGPSDVRKTASAPVTKTAASPNDLDALARFSAKLDGKGIAQPSFDDPVLGLTLNALREAAGADEPYTDEELKDLIAEQLRDDLGAINYQHPAIPLLREIGSKMLSQDAWKIGAHRAVEGAADFLFGVLDGVQPNPNAPRTPDYFGHTLEHALGQMLGATLGMAGDAALLAGGMAGVLASPVLAAASGGAALPVAVSLAAASASVVGASVLSGRNHAQHLGDALQTYASEAHGGETTSVHKPHRQTPRIEDGNRKEGWQHIDERHVSGTNPGGDLFPAGTTRAELDVVAKTVVRKGKRVTEDPLDTMQTFEKRVRVRGAWCDVQVVVQARDGNRVITMFPLKGSCK